MPIQLMRFSNAGVLDPEFREGGTQRSFFVVQQLVRRVVSDTEARALLIDPQDRLVVAGSGIPITLPSLPGSGEVKRFAVARFSPDGSEDTSFSADGIAVISSLNESEARLGTGQANAVGLDTRGRVLAAGEVGIDRGSGTFSSEFGIARFLPTGLLDTTFGGGFVTTNFSSQRRERANGVTAGPGGRVIGAGDAVGPGGSSVLAVARYRDSGVPDTTFNGDGRVLTDIPSSGSESTAAVGVDHLGRIVLSGVKNLGTAKFGLVRYSAEGVLDPSFGSGGIVSTDFPEGPSEGSGAMAFDAADRIVSAGFARVGNQTSFAITRHRDDGTLDPSFSGNGRQVIVFANLSTSANAVAIDRQGRIVVAGSARQPSSAVGQIGIARLLANGEPDSSFGNEGRVLTSFQTTFTGGLGMALDSAGRIVVAATATATAS
jgi:uncharacterized delta-60 repeat protein